MHHLSHSFNFAALLVAALIQFALGALWYSLFFAKPWMALTGHTKGEKPKGLAAAMASSVVSALLLPFVLVHMVYWSGARSAGAGALVGFLCWLGFVVVPFFAETIYERRPYKLFAINTGYWLCTILISGALLAVWR
jgi:hypothetical protein